MHEKYIIRCELLLPLVLNIAIEFKVFFSFLFSRRFLFAMCGADPEPHSQLCRPDNAELTYLLIQDAATIR